MVQYHIYPGAKRRVVTFSYDDGPAQDERLIALFNRYGIKATFHLNSCNFDTKEKQDAARKLYMGHEIACHTCCHGWLDKMPPASAVSEIIEDRRVLEKIAEYPVRGMSYPSGAYTQNAMQILAACGIAYSRTVNAIRHFNLPEDFLAWHPTCHHKDAMSLVDRFLDGLDSEWHTPLFYIWGHGHELRTEEDWTYMETLVSRLAGNDKIWYATNIQIVDYIAALHQLRINVDETVFENPTAIDLWVERNKKDIIHIPAGQTVVYP